MKKPAKPRAKAKARSKAKPAAKPARTKPARTRPARKKAARTKPARRTQRAAGKRAAARPERWQKFVEQHGVVLASARGPVPSVAEAIAGEPIVGSWWSHPRADAIFDALSALDDSDDIRCFKLVDRKITFVHRRLWPALACLARAGVLDAGRVASIQQEHMPTGEHRNLTMPFPDWLPDDVASAAASLSIDEARAQLGPWLD
ncbi:MAG TPA: hypothetical protein VK932_03385 [Kofleriaceae bacterium]|nr:hypothetical protein [Kofleriaceae bacterium]